MAGNSGIDNNIATASGVNVLAPTWYSVTDSSGNMSCYASAGLVNKMHQKGTDVWALVSDFDTNVDFAALYSSKKARTNMVNTLINDAENMDLTELILIVRILRVHMPKIICSL